MPVNPIQGSSTGYPDPSTNPLLQKLAQDIKAYTQIDPSDPSNAEALMRAQLQVTDDLKKVLADPTLKVYGSTIEASLNTLNEVAQKQAEQIAANAAAQEELNQQLQSLPISIITPGAEGEG